MEVHFYPGQKLLLLKSNDKVIGRYEAWGGPSSIGDDPYMNEEPTWPGNYVIGKAHRYHTPTWKYSQIRWGTKLKDYPAKNDVWYQLSNNNWGSISKDYNISRDEILNLNFALYTKRKVPVQWIFNDFGPVSIRWFKDTNGNGILDNNERLSGQMLHTTPDNEAQQALGQPIIMAHSHGCIHLKPAERDTIFAKGGFDEGTPFIVHKYNERFRLETH